MSRSATPLSGVPVTTFFTIIKGGPLRVPPAAGTASAPLRARCGRPAGMGGVAPVRPGPGSLASCGRGAAALL